MNGDEACCEGALAAGCRFFAGYPITPATEVAERMVGAAARSRRHLHPDGGRTGLHGRDPGRELGRREGHDQHLGARLFA